MEYLKARFEERIVEDAKRIAVLSEELTHINELLEKVGHLSNKSDYSTTQAMLTAIAKGNKSRIHLLEDRIAKSKSVLYDLEKLKCEGQQPKVTEQVFMAAEETGKIVKTSSGFVFT